MLTIDSSAIDSRLLAIIELREKLKANDNTSENYQLQKAEKDFIQQYGDQLSTILEEVHDDLCPDNTVKSPLDYLATHYEKIGKNAKGSIYDVSHNEGVEVDVDEYESAVTKLVILPNPLRVILNIDDHIREEVWSVNM